MAERGKKKVNLSDFFDNDIKEELKREIKEELKKELREDAFKDKVEKIEKKTEVKETALKKRKRTYIYTLVILIIIILILDLLCVYAYYKPNINLNFLKSIKSKANTSYADITGSVGSNKCKDGTPYDQCSKDKPYYCYEGNLLKKAATCGCPSGYRVDFQDCKKI